MQLTYSSAPALGFPGMIADTGTGARHIVSRVNPVDAIPFGLCVTKGTDDDHVKLPTTAGEVTKAEGFSVSDWLSESTPSGVELYPIKSAVGVLRIGRIWVTVEEAVVKGDDVYIRYASGAGGSQKGSVRKSADTATAGLLPSARFVTSAAIGALAMVEVLMP